MVAILNRIRLRIRGSSIAYHLIGSDVDSLEKEDDTGLSVDEGGNGLWKAEFRQGKRKRFVVRWLQRLAILLPSFLHASHPGASPVVIHETAWLDGLRGVAAFFVVWHHMSLLWFSWNIHDGWVDFDDRFVQLPIIRLAISGLPNVMVFFAISGYALSYKPLSLLRQDRHNELYRTLASSTFRRYPRLFIPAVVMGLTSMVFAYLGLFENGEGMPGAAVSPIHPPQLDTLWVQLIDYKNAVIRLCDIFTGSGSNWNYNNVLWTLPIEFRSSLTVFGLLLALSRCTSRTRMAIGSCVALYSIWFIHWAEFLFIGGMLVADAGLAFRASSEAKPKLRFEDEIGRSWWLRIPRSQALGSFFSLAGFVTSLFVLSMPKFERNGANSAGFRTLAAMVPGHFHQAGSGDYFWLPLAAVCLVMSIDSSRLLQRPFTTRFARYLGQISYSLYLIHLVILQSVGFIMGKYFVSLTGSETNLQYFAGILCATILFWPITIWAADLGWRFIDAKVVKFAGWTYNKLCRK
ncbi:acyltransferase family-domain-containing protein [Biscogniauxia marginata]|nr:acyltransferase family-domain-containing protein [Biscogniauxia marginata]